MVKLKSVSLGMILLLCMTACQIPSSSQVAELPTLVEFPTDTETAIPSDTPDATDTATATHTATVTSTASATATPTNTATHTATATWTALPSATPTNTQTFTPSPSPTPEASPTPIPTRTSSAPVIETFQASVTNANNGDPIILRWVVQADSARFEVIDSAGNITEQFDVELVDTFSTNTPSSGTVVTYRLTAIRGTEEVRSIVTVDMVQNCTINWYFPNPPSAARCPSTAPITLPVFYQVFERGFMFRTSVNGQNRVCGVQFDRNLYTCYMGQTFTGTPPATPPAGFFTPDALLENTFYNDLATGGFWYNIIGWGTDTGINTTIQYQVGEDGLRYYDFPDGVYPFDPNLNGIGSPTSRIVAP